LLTTSSAHDSNSRIREHQAELLSAERASFVDLNVDEEVEQIQHPGGCCICYRWIL